MTKGVFTWIRIEFQSGSNSFRFCWDHKELNYICLHESGLSCNSIRIGFIPFFIPDWTLDPEWNVDSESCKLGSKFHSSMKLGMKSTFIMAEIKIVCKMGSFVHVFKSFNPEWDFHSPWSFNPQFILPWNTNWVWRVVRDWNSIRIHVNYPVEKVAFRRLLLYGGELPGYASWKLHIMKANERPPLILCAFQLA